MTTELKYPSKSGGQLSGALAQPPGSGKVGGVVVIQEWFGITDFIKSVCDRAAQAGFLALAPDLYHGVIAQSEAEAGQKMAALDHERAVAEIGDAVTRLKSDPRSNGRVAVMGFCLGGALAFASASSLEGLAALVPFYGIPQLPMDAYAKLKMPILAHFAKNDDWAKATVAQAIQAKVQSGGGTMDLHVYDAGHAFMRSTDPSKYREDSARLAWSRTVEFLKKWL